MMAGTRDVQPMKPKEDDEADTICGPRCVQYLIRGYRRGDPALYDLVREIQWPDLEKGSTLDRLDEALRQRGIFTKAVRLRPTDQLRWPHPVIVQNRARADGPLNHFVVWLPSSTSEAVRLWSWPEEGRLRLSDSDFREGRGEIALLTAPMAISDGASYRRYAGGWSLPAVLLAAGCVLGLVCARLTWHGGGRL